MRAPASQRKGCKRVPRQDRDGAMFLFSIDPQNNGCNWSKQAASARPSARCTVGSLRVPARPAGYSGQGGQHHAQGPIIVQHGAPLPSSHHRGADKQRRDAMAVSKAANVHVVLARAALAVVLLAASLDGSGRAVTLRAGSGSAHPHPTLIAGDDSEEDVPFQKCTTPNQEPGHCRHVRFCVLDDFKENFDRFKDYACVIEGKYIGVCCPDDKDLYDSSRDYPVSNRTRSGRGRGGRGGRAGSERDGRPTRGRKPKFLTGAQDVLGGDTCGTTRVRRRNQSGKVEGGKEAEPGQYPWMAALLRNGQQQFCGGVLLDSTHILTAAHCVYNLEAVDLTVGLGEYDLSRPNPERVQTFEVADILVHERFNPDAYTDDIAILFLEGEADLTDYVWPVCLPPPDLNLAEQLAVVIGWGTVYYGGPPSNVLMEVTLPIWSQDQCQKQFDQPILDTEICAGTEAGGRDSCQGDSGGPLLLQMSDGRWCNVGIVSFGVRCGEPGKPGVYTNVAMYLDWIAQNTR